MGRTKTAPRRRSQYCKVRKDIEKPKSSDIVNSGCVDRNVNKFASKEKIEINIEFAKHTYSIWNWRGKNKSNVLYLDDIDMKTTKALLDVKIKSRNLTSINENNHVINKLNKTCDGDFKCAHFEGFLDEDAKKTYMSIFYDGCGSIAGSSSHSNIWIGNILSSCLKRFTKIKGQSCIFAFTVCLRAGRNYTGYSYDQAEIDFTRQYETLLHNFGCRYSVIMKKRYDSNGRGDNMLFIMLCIDEFNNNSSIRREYVKNPIFSNEFLGFRPGTCFDSNGVPL